MHDVIHSFPSGRCPIIASRMPRRHLREVSHTHTLAWHSVCTRTYVAEDHAAPGMFPHRGRLLHIQTSAAFPSASGPLFPPGSGDRSQVAHRSAADIKVREGKGEFLWIRVYCCLRALVSSIPCSSWSR